MEILQDLNTHMSAYYEAFIVLLPKLIIGILIAIAYLSVFGFFRKRLVRFINSNAEDPLLVNFFSSIFRITNVIIAILLFLYVIGQGSVAGSILGAAGVSAFVIGFAFKDIGENFLAGVVMAFKRPFRIGDVIESGSVTGTILEVSLRDTHIKTFDGKDVYIPNGQIIKNPLYNYTIDGFIRQDFNIAINKDDDIEKARDIILEKVKSIPGILIEDKVPRTHVTEISNGKANIQIHYWINTFDSNYSGLELKSQAIRQCVEGLKQAGYHLSAAIYELKNFPDQSLQISSQKSH